MVIWTIPITVTDVPLFFLVGVIPVMVSFSFFVIFFVDSLKEAGYYPGLSTTCY
jgi:hypothetical protein